MKNFLMLLLSGILVFVMSCCNTKPISNNVTQPTVDTTVIDSLKNIIKLDSLTIDSLTNKLKFPVISTDAVLKKQNDSLRLINDTYLNTINHQKTLINNIRKGKVK